jgi:hypothetical protein
MFLLEGKNSASFLDQNTPLCSQNMAPNADAKGQHPELFDLASLRQDWHQKKATIYKVIIA